MSIKEPKIQGSAPGQYLGFSIQPVRLFYHLLTCPPGSAVGLEHADDISVHAANKVLIAEQCKSALSQNPISNWATDLWKTFANWLENIEHGHFNPDHTKFVLYVTPVKRTLNCGMMSALTTDEEIKTLIAKISKQRDGLAQVPGCNVYLTKFLEAKSDIQCALVRNFALINAHSDPIKPIMDHLASTVKPEVSEAACKFGIGHAKALTDEAIRSGKPALVDADAFRKEFQAFISKHDSEKYLFSLSQAPTDEIVEHTIASAPIFVRQLDWVDADVETKTRATSDFLRTSTDRTQWAADGSIFEGSLDEYDDRLQRRHAAVQQELAITFVDLSTVDTGKLLYVRCCQTADMDIERRIVPNYFLTGSLNSLADRKMLGWHPDYQNKLAEVD